MAPSWWSSVGSVKGYTAAQKASLKAADSMLRESRSRSFEDEYEPLSSLGFGGAATVARCVHRASGALVAAKRIPLASSSSSSSSTSSSSSSSLAAPLQASSARQAALVELASLILLQGAPHAIELLDAIEEKRDKRETADGDPSTNCVFIVTRLCAGGELFDSIVSKEHYCEREAALVVRALAGFLAAAHRVGVVHRDLKPENVMLLSKAASRGSHSPSSKSSSPTKAAAAAAWPAPLSTALLPPAPAAVPPPPAAASAPAPSSSLQRLPSRLCREASDVAAMLSAAPCPPPPPPMRSSFTGGEREKIAAAAAAAARRRTTGTGGGGGGGGPKEVAAAAFFEEEEEQEERGALAAAAAAAERGYASSLIEGRRRCSCREREGIRVIDLGCAALFDPGCPSPSAAAAADAAAAEALSSSSSSSSKGSSLLKKMVGTPYYAAPEVLPNSPFPLRGAASDVWSLGVIAFVLLSGRPPFGGRDDAEVARRVAAGRFSFRGEAWGGVSDAARAAISSMLERDPGRRATAAQVLECEWLSSSKSSEKAASAAAARAAKEGDSNSAPSSSPSPSSSTRLRARIRAFAAESKLHAVAALALTRTVSGAEGAAQLREMILLQEEGLSSEDEEDEDEEEDGSDDCGGDAAPRLGGGGASVVPSSRAPPASHRCSAPGGLEGEKEKNEKKNKTADAIGGAPGISPRAAAAAAAAGSKGGNNGLGGLLRRTLTLGASSSSASAAAALAAAAAALPPGCHECETCGGIVVEWEQEEEEEQEDFEREKGGGAEAFLEGLLERPNSSASSPPPEQQPVPPVPLLRKQATVGAERAAELAFAALDADGDGWLSAEDLLRAGKGDDEDGKAEKRSGKRSDGSGGGLMTREEALACIAEASHGRRGGGEGGRDQLLMDFEGFKRVLWRRRRA